MTRILMIEDDRSVTSIVEGYLRQQVIGLHFRTAPTLAFASQTLSRERFDIVLLDVELPDGNGLAWLESDPVLSAHPCPVIVMSSSDQIRTVFAAINAGAEKYLDKSMASVVALPGLIANMTHTSNAPAIHAA